MEPWLTGTITDIDPLRASLLYSFQHAREDVAKWAAKVPEDKLAVSVNGLPSVGFQIRHVAGAVDRLMAYAMGRQLTPEELAAQQGEMTAPALTLQGYLDLLNSTLARAEDAVRALDVSDYNAVREIGRMRIKVPLGVLLVHIAEHTQRHLGQLVTTAKILG